MQQNNTIYFIGFYISIFITALCYAFNQDFFGFFFKLIIFLFLGLYLFSKNSGRIITFEKIVLLLSLLLFFVFLYKTEYTEQKIFNPLFCSVIIIYIITYFTYNYFENHFKKWINENKTVLCIIFVFCLLSVEVINSFPMWDANVYYSQISKILTSNSFNIYDLYLAGHASFGYSVWVMFFCIFFKGSAAVQIADISLASISIFAYYQIIKKLLGKEFSDKAFSLATAIFAFSPYVLGMVGNISVDAPTMYFAVIFLACSLYGYKDLELIIATCFCFTKEPSIIFYSIYVIVKILYESEFLDKFDFKKLTIYTIETKKNYIYLLPVFFWIILYILNPGGGWGSAENALIHDDTLNSFGFNKIFIFTKLKQILFVNFNWVFWLILVLGFISLLLKKIEFDKKTFKTIIPFSALSLTVIIFGCLYVTWVHIRYILPFIPGLYILATLIISKFSQKLFHLWSGFLGILLLIQSFYVIDPVMNIIFPSLPIGNYKIYSTQIDGNSGLHDNKTFHDSIVYNRQYLYWEEALEKVLSDSDYASNMLLVLPDDLYCTQYELFGAFNPSCLWDTSSENLVFFDKNISIPPDYILLQIYNISNVEEALGNDDILYIIPAWAQIDQHFISNKKIIKKGEVSQKGYTIQYMILRPAYIDYNLPLSAGKYTISPKQDTSLNICTTGKQLLLNRNINQINLRNIQDKYEIIFEQYQVAIDIPSNKVDSNGSVQAYPINNTEAQKWTLEKLGKYYLICYKNYALTYNFNNDTLYLSEKTGAGNQQWLFNPIN